jgi:UDP-N-acetylglucosamine 1-carboxyvinyltransferase
MSVKYVIEGGHQLKGDYAVQGNKNAALPLIAASLLSERPIHFENVPCINDVDRLIELVEHLGVAVSRTGSDLTLHRGTLDDPQPAPELVRQLRGSVLLLGALAAQHDQLSTVLPGGCPIGQRSFESHWQVFESAGFQVKESYKEITLTRRRNVPDPRVCLEESSVTATENALLLFCGMGRGIIDNPAREPHVLSLVEFLRALGCEIELHPLRFIVHTGPGSADRELRFKVPADYIDAGTAAIAAAVTGGELRLHGVTADDLLGFQQALEHFGLSFDFDNGFVRVGRTGDCGPNPGRITAGLWPSFPTDLTSILIVLATQGRGICLVHDWMYESRMFFVDKLARMGARVILCDPHRVIVDGPSALRGIRLESPDIRAGMALLVAGLCASGVTTIEHAEVVERGYERAVERFRRVGARVERR